MLWIKRLDRIARCTGIACTLAVAIAAIEMLLGRQGLAGLAETGVILTAGAVIGAVWAAGSDVPVLSCAMWIDQRMHLQDLLATAWTVRASEQAWERSVVAMADARCRVISRADSMPPFSGGRTWSAIALGAALAVCFGMINPTTRRVGVAENPNDTARSFSPSPQEANSSVLESSRPAGDAALNEPSNRTGADFPTTAGQPSVKGDSSGDGATTGNHPGTAAGMSRSNTAISSNSAPVQTDGNSPTAARGTIAGGGTGNSSNSEHSKVLSGPSSSSPTAKAPPWQTAAWPAAQSAAMQSVQSGAIDPVYQSIVRDYFTRQ